ncbi:hypothetical protein ACS0TY_015808 [Phlomoides rotata]
MSSNAISRRLEGKVAIVTGGASGIGASTVRLFWEHGAKVVIGDIQDDKGRGLANNLGGERVCYIHCDVTNEDQIINLIDATVAKFGQLDIMCSNAGVMETEIPSIINVQKSDLERILGVNLVGGFLAAKHAARVMIPNKKGSIIFTASACTKIAGIAPHSYTTSKHGIVGLAMSLAAELGLDGIKVNCISPFGLLTGSDADDEIKKVMFEKMMEGIGNLKGKVLNVEDIAKAALYLASDEGSYVSGMNLVVDGAFCVVNPSLFNIIQGFTRT